MTCCREPLIVNHISSRNLDVSRVTRHERSVRSQAGH
jgi:hypothetical protein